jgi:hypothetical protein
VSPDGRAKCLRIVGEIDARVRPTICPTFSGSTGRETIEGRISADDFETLLILAGGKVMATPALGLSDMQRLAISCGNEPYADDKVCPTCGGKGHV